MTRNIGRLKNVKIDRYFWKDDTQTTTWKGPVTNEASLGTLTPIASAAKLDKSNVIGQLILRNLVLLRGTYTGSGGGSATHWMLATLYTNDSDNKLSAVVANDPWTGWQVLINPQTKRVVSPANFPLADFKIDAYQAVMLD